MQRIQSFQIDHDLLDPGIYVSRVDGDITTYDLRTRKPNAGDYMDNVTMHSVEHMIATFIRNSSIADQVIYFGPMGCQTGFYLLIRNADNDVVLATLKTMLQQVIDHEGLVFGASQKECGNYRNLDIECAKRECRRYLDCLNAKPTHDFTYAQ
jgi:S-ribosylhomocysteine lyase